MYYLLLLLWMLTDTVFQIFPQIVFVPGAELGLVCEKYGAVS